MPAYLIRIFIILIIPCSQCHADIPLLRPFIQRIRPIRRFFLPFVIVAVKGCYSHAQPKSWRTTPCRLSADSSVYSQLSPNAGGRPFHPQHEDASCCGDRGPEYYTWGWPIRPKHKKGKPTSAEVATALVRWQCTEHSWLNSHTHVVTVDVYLIGNRVYRTLRNPNCKYLWSLGHCATSRKAAGLKPHDIIDFLIKFPTPSGLTGPWGLLEL
jgi:hypothetical protein